MRRIATRLRTARTRRILAAASALTALAPLALLVGALGAGAAGTLDVYAVKGGAAGVRITVQTGYSFVVEPDAMIPRATAGIEADQVLALASPADPGDSVDSLPGVGLPTAEQDIENGAATPNPLPSPFPVSGSTPPPQFTQAVDSVVSTFASTFNPRHTVPYEHAVAQYPNPSGEAERSTFPVGSADSVPPDLPDLFGLAGVRGSSGWATAAPAHGVADSGVGAAVDIPALGLSIGRISSHVDVRGTTAAISTAQTMLQDVDVANPATPDTPLLHIGTLVLTVTTQRAPGAPHAVASRSLEASGVTVAGQAARLDENGISVNGSPVSPLNSGVQSLIAGLNSKACAPQPTGVPGLDSLTAAPTMQIGLPTLQDQVTHHGNEDSVTMTGPTLCLAGSAPVPNTGGVAPTPTIYKVTLGDVSSSAYGVSFGAAGTGGGTFLPPLSQTFGGAGGNTTTETTITNGSSSASANPPQPPTSPGGVRGLVAKLVGGILQPPVVVTVATLAELALLATLWLSYHLARTPPTDDASPATRLDLV